VTEKKTKGKKGGKTTDTAPDIIVIENPETIEWSETQDLTDWKEPEDCGSTPAKGPDYHITEAGEILLDSGGPIPEDHPVHPIHRALAAARKASQ
jgi:hypothetical protein